MDPIRLVISDVDGTLVDKQKQLTAPVADAIRRWKEAGGGFTLISARPRSGLQPLVDALALDQAVAAFNGGLIYRRSGEVAEHHTIPAETARAIWAEAEGEPVDYWIFADDRWFASSDEGVHVEHERIASNSEPVLGEDMAALLDRADKITFVSDEPDVLRNLHDRIRRHDASATIGQSQTYYLDVTALEANKGTGVAALCAAFDVPLSATAVIGDQNNDLPMLEQAGYAIAMGNAPANVQAAADAVTRANDQDGVAHAIDELILPRLGANA